MLIQIPNHPAVKKLGRNEGKITDVAAQRLIWKATAEDTAFAFAIYDLELAPGQGIPVHLHPYAEVFFVTSGEVSFAHFNQGHEEWITARPGETVVAPMTSLHAFHNRSAQPARFLSISSCLHEAFFSAVGKAATLSDPPPGVDAATLHQQIAAGEQYGMTFPFLLNLSVEETASKVGEDLNRRNNVPVR